MLSHSQFALAASNDIKQATGHANLSLAVVFFTNRVIAATANHPIMARTIEMAADRLAEQQKQARAARSVAAAAGELSSAKGRAPKRGPKKKGAFHITGPYVLNLALQEVGDSTLVQVIPKNWVYPESLKNNDRLVMFGHAKDRRVHQQGVAISDTAWNSKPWLMHRSMPNYFTKALQVDSRFGAADYRVQSSAGAGAGDADAESGAIAVFLHHNKAGGSGVKVALQQLQNFTSGLKSADIFSKSACAYVPAHCEPCARPGRARARCCEAGHNHLPPANFVPYPQAARSSIRLATPGPIRMPGT